MTGFLTPILLALAALFLFFFVGWIGFRFLPNVESPDFVKSEMVVEEPLDPNLPDLVSTFYSENIGDPVVVPTSLVAWGKGSMLANRIPLIGQMWLPLVWKLYMVPGETLSYKVRVTWFTRTFFEGSDSYRDGLGRFTMGTNSVINKNVHRSEQVLMWLLSFFLAPSAVLGREDLKWHLGRPVEPSEEESDEEQDDSEEESDEEVDDTDDVEVDGSEEEETEDEAAYTDDEDVASVTFQTNEGDPITFTLVIDREASELKRVETKRPTAKSGKWLPYHIKFEGYHESDEGVFLPTLMTAAWENEDYLKLELIGVRYNVTVGESMLPEVIEAPEENVEEPEEELDEEEEESEDEEYEDEEYEEGEEEYAEDDGDLDESESSGSEKSTQ
jgi:hypothetical protein